MKLSNTVKLVLPAAVLGFLALGLGLAPPQAAAATVTTTFGVTASVGATCLVSATPMNFGSYTGLDDNVTSTVTVTCTNTTPYNLGLSAGLASGATVASRDMTGPAGALLGYELFRDAGHTLNWGVTIGSDTETGIGNGSAQGITVYGQVPPSQYVAPGTYSDTITATVTY